MAKKKSKGQKAAERAAREEEERRFQEESLILDNEAAGYKKLQDEKDTVVRNRMLEDELVRVQNENRKLREQVKQLQQQQQRGTTTTTTTTTSDAPPTAPTEDASNVEADDGSSDTPLPVPSEKEAVEEEPDVAVPDEKYASPPRHGEEDSRISKYKERSDRYKYLYLLAEKRLKIEKEKNANSGRNDIANELEQRTQSSGPNDIANELEERKKDIAAWEVGYAALVRQFKNEKQLAENAKRQAAAHYESFKGQMARADELMKEATQKAEEANMQAGRLEKKLKRKIEQRDTANMHAANLEADNKRLRSAIKELVTRPALPASTTDAVNCDEPTTQLQPQPTTRLQLRSVEPRRDPTPPWRK